MRVPFGTPIPFTLRIRQRFPLLTRLSRPSLGTVSVTVTVILTSAAVFAVCIYPKLRSDYYKEVQERERAFIRADREQLADGLRPWSNPFERK
uniref:Small integral membrane protein 20 n=1 Tax=Ascaris lumbricoides TaxID=6252 RepID=A0A0M3HVZ2_ASCLU